MEPILTFSKHRGGAKRSPLLLMLKGTVAGGGEALGLCLFLEVGIRPSPAALTTSHYSNQVFSVSQHCANTIGATS